jgi:hypothetical protein
MSPYVETPPDRMLVFDPETFWFKYHVDDPVVRILSDADQPLSKGDLARRLVSVGKYKSPSGAYKSIERAKQNQLIEPTPEGKFVVSGFCSPHSISPVSNSPGEQDGVERTTI